MCIAPIDAWRSKVRNPETGKRKLVFSKSEADLNHAWVTVPCGKCVECRVEFTRGWAVRCMHEASLHDENYFLTLTYSDESLPEHGSLCKKDFRNFIRRLRRARKGKVRYYHCGEYGDRTFRPHYHALLFGVPFPDKKFYQRRGNFTVWHSCELEELWPEGFAELGEVSFESAQYVARYILKRFRGSEVEESFYYGDLEPEYATMSRNPGIGAGWIDEYGDEVFRHDSIVVRGNECSVPRYYQERYEVREPEKVAKVKAARQKRRDTNEERSSRLLVRKHCREASVRFFDRSKL